MHILTALHFFSFLTFFYLAVYVVLKHPRARLNRSCAALLMSFCIWSFSLVFAHNPDISKDTANFFYNISAFGWASFASLAFYFSLVLSDKKTLLRSKLLKFMLCALPVILIYEQWSGNVGEVNIKQSWGWPFVWQDTIWTYLFFGYYCIFIGMTFLVLIDPRWKKGSAVKKKQSEIFLITAFITLIAASVTDVILPEVGIYNIPNMAPSFALIWAFGLVYAIARYKLLDITPYTAADNIISGMTDSLVLLNTEMDIVFVNEATTALLGYKWEEIIDKRVDMLFPSDLKEKQSKKIVQEKGPSGYDFILLKKDGSKVPVIFSSSPVKGLAGELVGTVCLAKDITEREKAEKMQRFAQIGRLSGGMAHEINNPLQVISGYAQLLLMREDQDEDAREKLKIIMEQCQKSKDLTHRMIALTKPIGGTSADLVLTDILDEVISFFEHQFQEANITISKEYASSSFIVRADEKQLREVFMNLLTNAFDAMPGGGDLKISVSGDGNKVVGSFKDTGVGISKDDMDEIFSPFFSTKDMGTGLGLSVSSGIVKYYGGELEVASDLGKGTTATVIFPIVKG